MFTKNCLLLLCLVSMISSCYREAIPVVVENDPRNGGFQKVPYCEMETPPDMVLVQGKKFPDLSTKDPSDSIFCEPFYISKYEETNGQYLTYVLFLKKYYSEFTYKKALPDTTVWQQENLTDSDKNYLIENYFRNPLYSDCPVVGVSPEQIQEYALWKSDRVNEFILIRETEMSYIEPRDSFHIFSIRKYWEESYSPQDSSSHVLVDLDPKKSGEKKPLMITRMIRMEDGILLPEYRLPKWEEWMLASLAIGNSKYGYVKTIREENHSQKIRSRYFDFLKIKTTEKEISKSSLMIIQKIGKVYSAKSNNYSIYRLGGGVREIVQLDSLIYAVTSGSWKAEQNYSAVYQKTTSTYLLPMEITVSENIDVYSKGVYGFRLAIHRDGGIHSKKRKRGK